MHVWDYVDLLLTGERRLADALAALAERHAMEPDVGATGMLLASWSREHVRILSAHTARPLPSALAEPAAPPSVVTPAGQDGESELLLDLQDAWRLAQEVHLRWTVLGQAARVLRDRTLAAICADLGDQTDRQLAWLRTRIEAIAPQELIAGVTGARLSPQ